MSSKRNNKIKAKNADKFRESPGKVQYPLGRISYQVVARTLQVAWEVHHYQVQYLLDSYQFLSSYE